VIQYRPTATALPSGVDGYLRTDEISVTNLAHLSGRERGTATEGVEDYFHAGLSRIPHAVYSLSGTPATTITVCRFPAGFSIFQKFCSSEIEDPIHYSIISMP
jgi:hypothetical protein